MIIAVVMIVIAGPVERDGRKARAIQGGDVDIVYIICTCASSTEFVLIIFVEYQVGHQVSGPIRIPINGNNIRCKQANIRAREINA